VRRANGDTYHTPNCSPQVAGFNQSQKGGIWGQLENLVLAQTKKKNAEDDFTLFAGPVLADDDEFFEGFDEKGPVRIQIPQRFWKIVVDLEDGALRAFAFVLEQDLSNVQFTEAFNVDEKFAPMMVSIDDLEGMLTGVRFPQELKDADQFGTDLGEELLKANAIERREPAAVVAPNAGVAQADEEPNDEVERSTEAETEEPPPPPRRRNRQP
jgi:endonuclease G